MRIFSEREPCVKTITNADQNCTQHIMEYMPEVDVTYAVDYGITRESGSEARRLFGELLNKLL